MSRNEVVGNIAKALVLNCVRSNTSLESLHCGIAPSSKTGDYSDVKVVTPHEEIQWEHLSRLNDREMKKLMIEIVNNVYTFLRVVFEKKDGAISDELAQAFSGYKEWNEPLFCQDFAEFLRKEL